MRFSSEHVPGILSSWFYYLDNTGCFFPCLNFKGRPNAPPMFRRTPRVREVQQSLTVTRQATAFIITFRKFNKPHCSFGPAFIGEAGMQIMKFFMGYFLQFPLPSPTLIH
jgi:hypothetical protein